MTLSWSAAEAEPGDDVVLRVAAEEPASLVGVLVVDKATKKRGAHNDITKDGVSSNTSDRFPEQAEPQIGD